MYLLSAKFMMEKVGPMLSKVINVFRFIVPLLKAIIVNAWSSRKQQNDDYIKHQTV